MSERKTRGSLMELSKPRLAQTPLSTPVDEAERRIFSREPSFSAVAGSSAPAPGLEREGPSPAGSRLPGPDEMAQVRPWETQSRTASEDVLAKLRKTRQPIAVVGFKLPAKLKEELAVVAQHNSTDMTRIVVEALERFLSDLPHPPGWEK